MTPYQRRNLEQLEAYAQRRTADGGITPRTFMVGRVLALLADRQGQCWPSYKAIAARVGCSVKTVERAVMALKAAGFLMWRKRWVASRRRATNLYTLCIPLLTLPLFGWGGRRIGLTVEKQQEKCLPAATPAKMSHGVSDRLQAALSRMSRSCGFTMEET